MQRVFLLTEKGVDTVAKIDQYFHHERLTPQQNAAIKTMHSFSDLPACVALYAIGIADEKDLSNMVSYGYATWHEIDQQGD